MKKKKIKKQGRDLNVLYSLNGEGQKLVSQVIPNKRKCKKVKHKGKLFDHCTQ